MAPISSNDKALRDDIGSEVLASANRLLFYPQPGPQTDLLAFKAVPEVLFGGARGGGKTAALLGDFVSDVPVYKSHWIGVLFRRTYPELEEVIRQSFEFYPQTGATYNANEKMWKWPNGAKLYLRYMAHPRDATNYQGHQFTWIGFDELGNFATDEGYQKIIATLRSPHNVPLKRIRATANPGGIGHGWVKERFQISNHPEGYKLIEVDSGLNRMFIPSRVKDNLILLKNDPSYIDRLKEVGSPEMVRAWLYGDWDVVAGAYFPEFSPEHVTDSIDVEDIPNHWKIYRAYDHGTYHPFCVLWYTFAGEDWKGIKKGTIVILREWYGGNEKGEGLKMSLVDVRDGIAERESTFRRRVEPGPADNQIFENHGGQSIADAFAVAGIYFARSDKARIPGWNQVRLRLREKSVLITRHCRHLIRTLPMLQHDEAKPEDVDTRGEDHCFIGSTLVDTEYGQIRIDTMPENGNVYTKDGLRPYVNCGLKRHAAATVNIFFNNGQKIRCTPDHKFLTIDGRWVEAADLMGEICYKVSVCEPQLSAIRSKSLTELDTTGVVSISNEMGSGFIGRFGKPITEPSQKDFTFIIATKIATIIKSKILNFFQGAITSRYTCRLKKGSKHPENVWTFPEQKRPNGINQKKVEHGIGNILKRIAGLGSLRKIRKLFVSNAGQNLRGIKKQNFAQITAKPNGEDYLGLMTRTGPAQCVRQFTESINTHEKIPVQSNAQAKLVPKKEKEFHNLKVVAVEKAECADVYCLHVPSVENFSIEGGIIVHNCSDVLRYITMVWPVIPKYHREHKRSKDGNAPTWADLVDATDDVTRRWRL